MRWVVVWAVAAVCAAEGWLLARVEDHLVELGQGMVLASGPVEVPLDLQAEGVRLTNLTFWVWRYTDLGVTGVSLHPVEGTISYTVRPAVKQAEVGVGLFSLPSWPRARSVRLLVDEASLYKSVHIRLVNGSHCEVRHGLGLGPVVARLEEDDSDVSWAFDLLRQKYDSLLQTTLAPLTRIYNCCNSNAECDN